MDDLTAWISKWAELVDATHSRLQECYDGKIDREILKQIAVQRLGAESEILLTYHNLPSVEELMELLAEDAKSGLLAGSIQEIQLDESLFPPEMLNLHVEGTYKSGGEIWRIHKYDADPFPSNPHAHNVQTGLKLHLGTGELFEKSVSRGRLPCKSLRRLRDLVHADIKLPDDTCN